MTFRFTTAETRFVFIGTFKVLKYLTNPLSYRIFFLFTVSVLSTMPDKNSKKSNLGGNDVFLLTNPTKSRSHYLANKSKTRQLQKGKLNKVNTSRWNIHYIHNELMFIYLVSIHANVLNKIALFHTWYGRRKELDEMCVISIARLMFPYMTFTRTNV